MIQRVVVLVLACVLGGFFWGGRAMAQECLSGSCHQALTKAKYIHGPVAAEMAGSKACVICHEPAGAKCTPTKGGVFKLKSKALCLTCHDKGTGSQHSQGLVESKCLSCHDPHGSETSPQLLRAVPKK